MDTILLKDLHGFCQVHVRVGQNIVGRDRHLLSGFIHFIHCVKKASRSDDGYDVDLIRLNQERMRIAFREKHGFTRCNFEHLPPSVRANTSREDIEELILPCVDVRKGFGPFLIFETTKSKAPPVSASPASWVASIPLYQVEFSSEVERLYAFGAVNWKLIGSFPHCVGKS
jgi:hypothetical protein